LDEWGRIDILVCNAATNPVYGPMADANDAAFDKIMAVNLKGAFWLCNMVLPQMAERRDGVVILISSIAGLRGNPRIGIYGLSKAAEIQLARNLAVEWGEHNIRVNCIAPGLIKTDFAQALWSDPKISERALRGTPLKRIGEPRDIAGIAVFLAGEAARYITGQVIVADGGVTISDAV
jgi:NAD(P)-dependent dehydrogenase (short-subunit alcohol dehydrogenase family)